MEAAGFESVGEPGTPVWHQLTTGDDRKVLDFYHQVFDWRTEPVSSPNEFSYTTALFDGQPLLAVKGDERAPSEDNAAHWSTFFGTDDLENTLQVIACAGGTLLRPIEDTPYGRIATTSDPTGVTFHLASLRS